MAGAYVTTPVGDGALTFSGRRSYADFFTEGTDLYTQWPAFWDYLSRYDHKIDSDQSLYLTALGSKDSYGRSVEDPDNLDPFEQATINALEEVGRATTGTLTNMRSEIESTLQA